MVSPVQNNQTIIQPKTVWGREASKWYKLQELGTRCSPQELANADYNHRPADGPAREQGDSGPTLQQCP